MADSPLKKRKKDAPEPFSWVPRPTNAVRGRANPGLTARTAPAAPVGPQPGRDGWFQPMGRADISRITSKYGTGQQPIVTAPANPLLGPGGPTVSSVGGPIVIKRTGPTEEVPWSPAVDEELSPLRDPQVTNPNLRQGPTQEVPMNPAIDERLHGLEDPEASGTTGIPGATDAQPTTPKDSQDSFFNSLRDTGGTRNPLTGAPVDDGLQDWLANGGSVATWHRQQVKSGLRPAIDARATPSAMNSTAGDEIAAARGWGKDADKDARGIANQMTGEFNQNNAAAQKAWNDKFTQAHADLMKKLNNNP